MTAEQFERVFLKAQDIQTKRYTKKEILEAEKAMRGFEEGVFKEATSEQAAYILNLMCMDISGDYSQSVLIQLRECYLQNVRIIRGKNKSKRRK